MKCNLSGIYFREKINGRWDNVCFEDCSEEKQKKIIKEKSKEFVGGLAIMLAQTLKEVGDRFNILKE